jgi:hypothetical protein
MWISRFTGVLIGLLAALASWSHAAPINPGDYPSGQSNPFVVPGVYTVSTSGTPTLSGPSGTVIGMFTADNVAVFWFDSISIGPGVIVVARGSRPLALISLSTFQILAGGRIDLSGRYEAGVGYVSGAGGADGSAGPGQGPGGGGAGGSGNGGGGAGYGAVGGRGGGLVGGFGGPVYGNLATMLQGGSGGGGTGGLPFFDLGGSGGGGLEIGAAQSVTLEGEVLADGSEGSSGPHGGGGGSGGGVMIHAPSVTLSGLLSVRGGRGGDGASGGGGGGASGRALVFTDPGGLSMAQSFVYRGAGGFGGLPQGNMGGSTGAPDVQVFPPPPHVPAIAGCLVIAGTPLAGVTVKLKQRGDRLETLTANDGCFAFDTAVSGRDGTLTVELPPMP